MKLSFSIKGWDSFSWGEYCRLAKETGFTGIELHNSKYNRFPDKNNPFDPYTAKAVVREMMQQGLSIPCIDSVGMIADFSDLEENTKEIKSCIDTAKNLYIPFVRVRTGTQDTPQHDTHVIRQLEEVLPYAQKQEVVLLLETTGVYADTKRLRDILNHFASDYLAALWDMHHPFTFKGELPETTIENLGAYIRHIHIKDSYKEENKNHYCLIGEGQLPISDMMLALRSINYDGFISLEWDCAWLPQLPDIDIILAHFVSYMHRFSSPAKGQRPLYNNKANTGKFIWKKDVLIEKTFSQVLDDVVEEFPDQIAVSYTTLDYTRTYSQFRNDVDDFAKVLVSMGVKAGHHVAVWATNVPQWYIAFWATTKIGAVLVSMNTAYKIHEAEYLLKQSDTHTLIMMEGYRDSNYKEIIQTLCPEMAQTKAGAPLHCKRLPFLRNVITVGFNQKGCFTWQQALQKAKEVPSETIARMAAAVSPHDVCNMQYTSGTTGFPKGVMLTHFNIVNNGKCIGDRMDLSTADRMMIHVPMFHCFGMVLAMTASMSHGVSIYPLPYFSPKTSLDCINRERITCFHGVPTMFIAMLEHGDFAKTDFSYMRTGIMAGSPCPISVMQDVVDKMHMNEITIVYGQTESSPGCTMSSTDDPLEVRVGTVGRNLPEIECKIVHPETGEDMPDNETGEFVARGYNIMKGYYKMPKATNSAIDKEGWLHTGDLACRTPQGNFKITGRLKDMIIRGGENIYPKEIEEFIYTHPKVKDVQVIGVPDTQYGEEIMACIIVKDGESTTEEEMKQFVTQNMARHKVPRYIDFVESFPMNVAGKILKYQMREQAIEKLNLQQAKAVVTA